MKSGSPTFSFLELFFVLHILLNNNLLIHLYLVFLCCPFTGIQQVHQSPGSPQVNVYFEHGYLWPDKPFSCKECDISPLQYRFFFSFVVMLLHFICVRFKVNLYALLILIYSNSTLQTVNYFEWLFGWTAEHGLRKRLLYFLGIDAVQLCFQLNVRLLFIKKKLELLGVR